MLTEVRDLIDSFQAMRRKKAADDLEPWPGRPRAWSRLLPTASSAIVQPSGLPSISSKQN